MNINITVKHHLGHFKGLNLRSQQPIPTLLTAQEIVDWNYDENGESVFWPHGDHEGVQKVFSMFSYVDACRLIALDRLLTSMGCDDDYNYIQIVATMSILGKGILQLSDADVEDYSDFVYCADDFIHAREDAAYGTLKAMWPYTYAMWAKGELPPGLDFDVDRVLDGPEFSTLEIEMNGTCWVIVREL